MNFLESIPIIKWCISVLHFYDDPSRSPKEVSFHQVFQSECCIYRGFGDC